MKKYHLKGPYQKEKDFQSAYLKKSREDEHIAFKIPDVGLGYKFLDAFFVSPSGIVEFIEFKIIDGETFNVSKFEQSQVSLLNELDKRYSDLAFVAIWSKKRNDYELLHFRTIWDGKNDNGGYKLFRNNPKNENN